MYLDTKLSQNCGWFGCTLKHLHLGLIPIVQLINFPNFKFSKVPMKGRAAETISVSASTLEPTPHLPLEVLASPAITWVYLDAAGGCCHHTFQMQTFRLSYILQYYIADTSWQEADNIHSSIEEDHFCVGRWGSGGHGGFMVGSGGRVTQTFHQTLRTQGCHIEMLVIFRTNFKRGGRRLGGVGCWPIV